MARTVHPGDLLRLGRLGVSITPVREALVLLSQDGWVTHEPNRGWSHPCDDRTSRTRT